MSNLQKNFFMLKWFHWWFFLSIYKNEITIPQKLFKKYMRKTSQPPLISLSLNLSWYKTKVTQENKIKIHHKYWCKDPQQFTTDWILQYIIIIRRTHHIQVGSTSKNDQCISWHKMTCLKRNRFILTVMKIYLTNLIFLNGKNIELKRSKSKLIEFN